MPLQAMPNPSTTDPTTPSTVTPKAVTPKSANNKTDKTLNTADTPEQSTPIVTALKNPKKRTPKKSPAEPQPTTEFLATEYKGVSIYAMAMAILIGLILWTGIATVQQVQAYHQQYSTLQQLKKDYRNLQIENQRLLIEQQTFSATPQIASRAVSELNMFYPQLSDRMIIQANNLAQNTATNTATATADSPAQSPAQIENGHVTPLHPVVEDPDELHLPETTQANQRASQATGQGEHL